MIIKLVVQAVNLCLLAVGVYQVYSLRRLQKALDKYQLARQHPHWLPGDASLPTGPLEAKKSYPAVPIPAAYKDARQLYTFF